MTTLKLTSRDLDFISSLHHDLAKVSEPGLVGDLHQRPAPRTGSYFYADVEDHEFIPAEAVTRGLALLLATAKACEYDDDARLAWCHRLSQTAAELAMTAYQTALAVRLIRDCDHPRLGHVDQVRYNSSLTFEVRHNGQSSWTEAPAAEAEAIDDFVEPAENPLYPPAEGWDILINLNTAATTLISTTER